MRLSLYLVVVAILSGCSFSRSQEMSGESTLGGTISGPILSAEDQLTAQDALIRRQEEELRSQARELDDLKRQEYHNQRVRKYETR